MELTWCQDICVNNLYGLNLGQHIQTVKAELWLKPFTDTFPVYCQILSALVCLKLAPLLCLNFMLISMPGHLFIMTDSLIAAPFNYIFSLDWAHSSCNDQMQEL
jgi:hypothetical protein